MVDPKEEEATPDDFMLMPSASAEDETDGVESSRSQNDVKDSTTLPLAPSLHPKLEIAGENVATFQALNDGEDADEDEHKRYSVRHKSKLLVQAAESNSFDDLDCQSYCQQKLMEGV